MNSVVLIGRLTADPIIHVGEQHESATFRLAVPRPGRDGAEFIEIVTFDKLAACCGEWLTKGREVAVVGKLRLNEWTGRDGGAPLPHPCRGRRRSVPRCAPGKKTGERSDDDTPTDKPAVGAYRRKAS